MPGGKVEVRVTDSGPGVPAEERERIFQVFNRREAGGRGGLGLAIVQAFLEAHGERIWVEDAGRRPVPGVPASSSPSRPWPADR